MSSTAGSGQQGRASMGKFMTALRRLFGIAPTDGMLDIAELKQHVDCGQGLVLDVRPAADFNSAEGHIATAVNIPVEDLQERLSEIGPDYTRPITIVCRTDKRSSRAAALLVACGYSNARVVRGGMSAWQAKRWPVQHTAQTPGRAAPGDVIGEQQDGPG